MPAPASVADIVDRARARYEFVRTPAGEPYAIPRPTPRDPNPRRVALTLDQVATRLAASFFETGDVPLQQTMNAALSVITAIVEETAPVVDVHLRMARRHGVTYLDLASPDTTYVEITPSGWTVRRPLAGDPAAPVLFTRSATTNELPVPSRDLAATGRAELARLLALSTEDPRFRIAWGWLVAQVLPTTARPMLYLLGSQGSGKTTRGLMLANVLEPQSEMGAVLKRSERENNPVAKANFILTADNMTKMSEDVSNWLCSLVTGHRVIERKLYTNAETIAYSLKRTGIFTGKVKPAGLESDAEERMLFLEFERMQAENIRADDDLLDDFRSQHAAILGAVLDDMVAALARLPDVDAAAVHGYRFVNFGRILVALDRLYGLPADNGHLSAVINSATDAQTERVHDAPDLVAILRAVAAEGGEWSGTVAELLDAIARWAPTDAGRPGRAWWPASAAQLGTRLRNQQHALSLAGLSVEFRRSNGARLLALAMNDQALSVWGRPHTIQDIEIIRRSPQ